MGILVLQLQYLNLFLFFRKILSLSIGTLLEDICSNVEQKISQERYNLLVKI